MNRSRVSSALVLIVGSLLMGFFGKIFALGGLLGMNIGTFVFGLGMTLLSPVVMGIAILYSVYALLNGGSKASSRGGDHVFAPGDTRAYCRSCGKVVYRNGRFCSYCGREQF